MGLNKQKGNMYGFVTHTWNVLKGECEHDCQYYYMKSFKQKPLRFDQSELKTDLGQGNWIFVGSSTDMWANDVDDIHIWDVLNHCDNFLENMYLFQTKNPERFKDFINNFPQNTILGVTYETNRNMAKFSDAPAPTYRINKFHNLPFPKMVNIEPIIEFDLNAVIYDMKLCNPLFVSIGANSKEHLCKLPEPNSDEIKELIKELEKFTTVYQKDNLKRLTGGDAKS